MKWPSYLRTKIKPYLRILYARTRKISKNEFMADEHNLGQHRNNFM